MVIAATVVIGLLIIRWMVYYRPPAQPSVTPAQAAHARQSIIQARKTLERASQAADEGKKVPFEVKLTEEDMTRFVSTDSRIKAKMVNIGLSQPLIQFRGGLISVSGLTKLRGRQVHVTISGKPTASEDGYIRLADTTAYVGKLDVTPMLAGRIEDKVDGLFRSGETRVPPGLKSITAQNGVLSMRGTSQ